MIRILVALCALVMSDAVGMEDVQQATNSASNLKTKNTTDDLMRAITEHKSATDLAKIIDNLGQQGITPDQYYENTISTITGLSNSLTTALEKSHMPWYKEFLLSFGLIGFGVFDIYSKVETLRESKTDVVTGLTSTSSLFDLAALYAGWHIGQKAYNDMPSNKLKKLDAAKELLIKKRTDQKSNV
jgi:hypothetical protein